MPQGSLTLRLNPQVLLLLATFNDDLPHAHFLRPVARKIIGQTFLKKTAIGPPDVAAMNIVLK